MRYDFRLQTLGFRLSVALLSGLALGGASAFALSDANPYAAIAGRNVFALKPPTPTTPATVTTPTVPPNIELQGFTTILGRAQVLLKIKLPPRPPEPAKDRSLVMDVGQREGDVEVIEMDAYAGSVKLKNQGNLVSLNLKDNGSKPTAGPALPAPGALPGVSSLPAPQLPPPTTSATPQSPRNLPSRQMRSPSIPGAATSLGTATTASPIPPVRNGPTPETMMSSVEQTAVIETLRSAQPSHYPPLPPTELTPNP
jgi:hypothetical protein